MLIIKAPTTLEKIKKNHNHFFKKMVKIVVDIENNMLALDADLHADLESLLLENESKQENLWGANIYFEGSLFLEFNSLINIRPHQNNPSMDIIDKKIKDKISHIVSHLIKK